MLMLPAALVKCIKIYSIVSKWSCTFLTVIIPRVSENLYCPLSGYTSRLNG